MKNQPEALSEGLAQPQIDRDDDCHHRHIADLVYACIDNGDLEGAIDRLDREIEIESGCAYLYAERANFRQRIGDKRGAIADYDRAIALQPHNQLFKQWRDRVDRQIIED